LLQREPIRQEVLVAGEEGEGRVEIESFQGHHHQLLAGAEVIGVAFEALAEANRGVFFEIRACGEHVGAEEAAVAVGGFVGEQHIRGLTIGAGQVVLGGDEEIGHGV